MPEKSGNFCERGGRFGTHASNENMTPIYYKRIMFFAHFNAGIRAVDIRDPYHPKEIAYYIPALTKNADSRCIKLENGQERCKTAIQTNNLEVDDRGYIYAVDRANNGLRDPGAGGRGAPHRQLAGDLRAGAGPAGGRRARRNECSNEVGSSARDPTIHVVPKNVGSRFVDPTYGARSLTPRADALELYAGLGQHLDHLAGDEVRLRLAERDTCAPLRIDQRIGRGVIDGSSRRLASRGRISRAIASAAARICCSVPVRPTSFSWNDAQNSTSGVAAVALGIDGDEQRLHVAGRGPQHVERGAEHCQPPRAQVGAMHVAEIDEQPLALEVGSRSPACRGRRRRSAAG